MKEQVRGKAREDLKLEIFRTFKTSEENTAKSIAIALGRQEHLVNKLLDEALAEDLVRIKRNKERRRKLSQNKIYENQEISVIVVNRVNLREASRILSENRIGHEINERNFELNILLESKINNK